MFVPMTRDTKQIVHVHGGATTEDERQWLFDADEIWYAKAVGWGSEPVEFDSTPERAVARLLASTGLAREDCVIREPERDR